MVLVGSAWLIPAPGFCAQEVDKTKAVLVKTTYLFNFAKFIQWPDDAFENKESPFIIGVFCNDSFAQTLKMVVRGKKIANRPVKIRRIRANEHEDKSELKSCHILYICRSRRSRVQESLAVLKGHPVLLVSDIKGFASKGGTIGFVLENGRIVFEISRQTLERSGLKASAKLLALAQIVKPKERHP